MESIIIVTATLLQYALFINLYAVMSEYIFPIVSNELASYSQMLSIGIKECWYQSKTCIHVNTALIFAMSFDVTAQR